MQKPDFYLNEAKEVFDGRGFWGERSVYDRDVEQLMGYYGSGDGKNNPASLSAEEKTLFYCFMAAIAGIDR